MNILALDLSLTATGWAHSNGERGLYSPPKLATGIRRMIAIRDAILGYATNADLVVIEGFAYGAKGRAVLDIAGMGWIVRVAGGHQVLSRLSPFTLRIEANAPHRFTR